MNIYNNSLYKTICQALPMAICVALLPPLWAAAACIAGISTGPVALITGGLFAAAGGKAEMGKPVSAGLLLGDGWALCAQKIITAATAGAEGSGSFSFGDSRAIMPLPAAVFLTLAVFGFFAVLLAAVLRQRVYLPAWLAGWAIGMLVMDTQGANWQAFLMTGFSMLVGVWYVGVFQNLVQKKLERLF